MSDNTSTQPSKGLAVAAMVCGILGLCLLPFLGLILGLIALILAIVALAKKRPGQGMAIAGLITGIVSMVLSIVLTIFTVIVIGMIADYCGQNAEICENYTQQNTECDLHFGADGEFSLMCSNPTPDDAEDINITDIDGAGA